MASRGKPSSSRVRPLPDWRIEFAEEWARLVADLQAKSVADDPNDAVHAFRVATKRLRALVRLFEGELPPGAGRKTGDVLRDLARELAGYRDTHVAQATLRRLGDSLRIPESPAPSGAPLEGSGESIDGETFRRLVERLEDEGRCLVESFPGEASWGWDQVEPGLVRTYRSARRRFHRWLDSGCELEQAHEWRKHVKYHLYQLDFLAGRFSGAWPKRRKRLKDLGHQLGLLNDLANLESWELVGRHTLPASASASAPDNGGGNGDIDEDVRAALVDALGLEIVRHQERCRRLGVRLFHRPPKTWRERFRQHRAKMKTLRRRSPRGGRG